MKNKDPLCFSTSGFTRPYSSTGVKLKKDGMMRLQNNRLFLYLSSEEIFVLLTVACVIDKIIPLYSILLSVILFICKEQIGEYNSCIKERLD